MFHLRRSALRLLSSAPPSFVAKPRSFTSFAPSILRKPLHPASTPFQRRWATGEAEAKEEQNEEVPISEIQPTPQEEVENAIISDNAAEGEHSEAVDAAASAESADVTEPMSAQETEEVSSKPSTTEGGMDQDRVGRDTVRQAAGQSGFQRGERGRGLGQPPEPKSTIYIGNLFFDITENDLTKEFSRFGNIGRCRLMRDARGLSKGFAYIDFDNLDSATKAIQTLNQQLFEGRRLTVQYAVFETRKLEARKSDFPQGPRNPPSKTLFVGNMSFEMTDRDLNNLFRGIRNVIDVRVAIDRRTGQPRGFAHADFVDVKSAMEGMKALQGKETYGRSLRVDYSYGPSGSPRNSGMPGSTPSGIAE